MRPSRTLACLAALAATSAFADPAPFDAYDPARLNERAVEHVRAGDLAGARILLERAARLAPFDDRVSANLRTLKAYEAGERASPALSSPPPPAKALPAVEPLPPALWPPHPGTR